MTNTTNIGKYDELMSTTFACTRAFIQACNDEIGSIYVDECINLKVGSIMTNDKVNIEFLTGSIRFEADRTFLGVIKNKLRLLKTNLKRKVTIYNDCIIIDPKSRFTDIKIEPINKFSGDHATVSEDWDKDWDMPSTEVLFGKHSLNESDQMFVKLFENEDVNYILDDKEISRVFSMVSDGISRAIKSGIDFSDACLYVIMGDDGFSGILDEIEDIDQPQNLNNKVVRKYFDSVLKVVNKYNFTADDNISIFVTDIDWGDSDKIISCIRKSFSSDVRKRIKVSPEFQMDGISVTYSLSIKD